MFWSNNIGMGTCVPAERGETTRDNGLLIAARGGGGALAGMACSRLLALLLQIVIARQFGVTFLGYYVTGLILCRILQVVAGLGLPIGCVRFMVHAMTTGSRRSMWLVYWWAISGVFVAGGVLGLLLYSSAPFLCTRVFGDQELLPVLRLFFIAVPWFAMLRLLAEMSRSFGTVRYTVLVEDILFFLVQLGVLLFARFWSTGPMVLIQGFLAAAFFCASLMGFIVYRQLRDYPVIESNQVATDVTVNVRELFAYSIPLMPTGVIFMTCNNIDMLMLNILCGGEAVGLYAAATRWTLLLDSMSVPLSAIFRPLIAGVLSKENREALQSLLMAAARWALYLALPCAAFLAVAAQPALGFFLKEGTAPSHASMLLWILLVGSLSNPVGNGAGLLLSMGGQQYKDLLSLAGGAFLNVLLNVLLIPRFGVLGAAVATGAGFYLTTALRLVSVWRKWRMTPWSLGMRIPLVVFCCMLLAGFILDTTVSAPSQLACGGVAACAVAWSILTFGLENDDSYVLKRLPRVIISLLKLLDEINSRLFGCRKKFP